MINREREKERIKEINKPRRVRERERKKEREREQEKNCCRVNDWSTFGGFLGQKLVHLVGPITGAHHSFCKMSGFQRIFVSQFFSEGCTVFIAFGCFGPKTGFSKRGW